MFEPPYKISTVLAGIIYILVISTDKTEIFISLEGALSRVIVINLGWGPGAVVKTACLADLVKWQAEPLSSIDRG